MDFTNIQLSQPIEPIIELDGGFAMCARCANEIEPTDNVCTMCHQVQDWSWFNKEK